MTWQGRDIAPPGKLVENLSQVVDRPAAAAPGRTALVTDSGELSFGELSATVEATAAALSSAGVGPKDRVVLAESSAALSLPVLLGGNRIGATVALVNPALTAVELSSLVASIGGAELYVTSDDLVAPLSRAFGAAGVPVVASGAVVKGAASEDGGAAPAPGARSAPVAGGDAIALYLFTSGTTGLPKPVGISHHAMLERVRTYGAGPQLSASRAVRLMCVPFFHIGGLLGLLVNLWNGNTTVIQSRFEPGEWLELVERHRVQASFLVPTMLHRIIGHPDLERRDLSSLRSLAYGAAAAPVELVRRAMAALPDVGFVNTFGQTETLGGYTALDPKDHRDPARIGSVGRPLSGVEVRVVQPGMDAEAAPGTVGELLVRSPQNVVAGWLHTGDLGRVDADGYVYPMGRLSDTINRGGEKFGPAEIETVLRRHPAIADAGVAGVPDAEMGERVGAAVVLDPGGQPWGAGGAGSQEVAAELQSFARQHLAPFKVPEMVVVVEQLPYNDLGKVSRASLAEQITDGLDR